MYKFDDEVEQQTALLMADRNETEDFIGAQMGDWIEATLHRLMNADDDTALAMLGDVRSQFAAHVKHRAEDMAVAAIQQRQREAEEEAAYVAHQFQLAA